MIKSEGIYGTSEFSKESESAVTPIVDEASTAGAELALGIGKVGVTAFTEADKASTLKKYEKELDKIKQLRSMGGAKGLDYNQANREVSSILTKAQREDPRIYEKLAKSASNMTGAGSAFQKTAEEKGIDEVKKEYAKLLGLGYGEEKALKMMRLKEDAAALENKATVAGIEEGEAAENIVQSFRLKSKAAVTTFHTNLTNSMVNNPQGINQESLRGLNQQIDREFDEQIATLREKMGKVGTSPATNALLKAELDQLEKTRTGFKATAEYLSTISINEKITEERMGVITAVLSELGIDAKGREAQEILSAGLSGGDDLQTLLIAFRPDLAAKLKEGTDAIGVVSKAKTAFGRIFAKNSPGISLQAITGEELSLGAAYSTTMPPGIRDVYSQNLVGGNNLVKMLMSDDKAFNMFVNGGEDKTTFGRMPEETQTTALTKLMDGTRGKLFAWGGVEGFEVRLIKPVPSNYGIGKNKPTFGVQGTLMAEQREILTNYVESMNNPSIRASLMKHYGFPDTDDNFVMALNMSIRGQEPEEQVSPEEAFTDLSRGVAQGTPFLDSQVDLGSKSNAKASAVPETPDIQPNFPDTINGRYARGEWERMNGQKSYKPLTDKESVASTRPLIKRIHDAGDFEMADLARSINGSTKGRTVAIRVEDGKRVAYFIEGGRLMKTVEGSMRDEVVYE